MISLAFMCGDAQRDYVNRMLTSVFAYPHCLVDEVVFAWNGTGPFPTLDVPPGVRVVTFRQEWVRDFSRSRNETFDRCSGDWIFWIDCDDVIAPPVLAQAIASANGHDTHRPLARPLADFLSALPSEVTAVWLPYDYDREEPIQLHPRILRRSANYRWQGRVQEELTTDHERPIWTEFWGLCLLQENVQTPAERQSRNVPILEEAYAAGERSAITLHYLAKAREDEGRNAEALTLYREACDAALRDPTRRSRLHLIASHATACALRHAPQTAGVFALTLVSERPDLPESWNALALASTAIKNQEATRRAFAEAEKRERSESASGPRFVQQPEFASDAPAVIEAKRRLRVLRRRP